MQSVDRNSWGGGANNIAQPERLPEGFTRNQVNLDSVVGGQLQLRAGYEKAFDMTDVRGMLGLDSKLLVADGADLIEVNLETNSTSVIRTIAGAGTFTGAAHHGELFFCTENEALRYDGETVRPWGIPQPTFTVGYDAGPLPAGTYKVAVVNVDATGAESGTRPAYIVLPANSALLVTAYASAGTTQRVYASPVNSPVMYEQQDNVSSTLRMEYVKTDTARCVTELMDQPPLGNIVRSHKGWLAIASGRTLFLTEPMLPHLYKAGDNFYMFGSDIVVLESVEGGLYICADKTYFLANPGTPQAQLRTIAAYTGVRGSGVQLPDGRAAWFSRYGQIFGDPAGTIESPNRESYAPLLAEQAACGIVEHNGRQMVVTTMRGAPKGNSLGVSDFFDWEIVSP